MRQFAVLIGLLLVLPSIGLALTPLQTTTVFDPDAWTFTGSNNEILSQQAPVGSSPYTVSFWFNIDKYSNYGNGFHDQGTLFSRGAWGANDGMQIISLLAGQPDNGDSTIPAQNFYTPSDYKTFNNNYQDLTLNVPQDGKPYKIEFWFKLKEYKTTEQGIQIFLSGGTHTDNKFLLIGVKDRNILIGHYANDWTTNFVPELNRWYKLALAWDGARENLYIDNKLVDSRQTFLNLKGNNFRMGAHVNAPLPMYNQYNDRIGDFYGYFIGSMTDVKVYDKVEQETYLRIGHWGNDWTTNFVPELKAWYYLTVTYDGATEKVYVNGILTDSKNVGKLDIKESKIYVGSMSMHPDGWTSYYFNGRIEKDLKILSSAISDEEATATYEGAKDAATFPAVILPQETVYLYGYSDYYYFDSPHDREYLRHIFYRTLVYEDGTKEIIDSYNSIPDKGEMKINSYGSWGKVQLCGVMDGEGQGHYRECWTDYYTGYFDGIIPEKTVKISKPGNYRVELKDIVLPPATAGRYPNITLQSTIDYWMDYDINTYKDGGTNCKENVYPNTGSTWHEHAFYSYCQGDKKLFSGIKPIDLPKDNPIFSDMMGTPSFYDGMPKVLHDSLKSYEFTVVQPVTIEGFKVCSNNDFNNCQPAKFAGLTTYVFPIVKATNPYLLETEIENAQGNVVSRSDAIGGTLSFSNNYEDVQLQSANNGKYTISFWFVANQQPTYPNIGRQGTMLSGGTHGSNRYLSIRIINDRIVIVHWDNDWYTKFQPEIGKEYFFTTTYDGTTEKLYIDGVLVDQKQSKFDLQGTSYRVGADAAANILGSYYYFNGQISDLKVLDYASEDSSLKFTPQAGKYTINFFATDLVNGDIDSQSQDLNFVPALVLATGKSKSPFEPAAGGSGGATGASPAIPLNGNTTVALLAGVGAVGAGIYLFKNRSSPSKLHIAGLKTTLTSYGKQQDAARESVKEQMRLAQKSLETYKKWKEEQEREYYTKYGSANGYYARQALAKLATAKSPADKKKYEAEVKHFLQAAGYTTTEAKSVVKTFTAPNVFGISPMTAQQEYNKRVNEILSGKIVSTPPKQNKKEKKGIVESVVNGFTDAIGGFVNAVGGFFANVFGSANEVKTAKAVYTKKQLAGAGNNTMILKMPETEEKLNNKGTKYKVVTATSEMKPLAGPLAIPVILGGAALTTLAASQTSTVASLVSRFALPIFSKLGSAYELGSNIIGGVMYKVENLLGAFKTNVPIIYNKFSLIEPPKKMNVKIPSSMFGPTGPRTDVEFVNEDDEKGIKIFASNPVSILAAGKSPFAQEYVADEKTLSDGSDKDLVLQIIVRHDNIATTSVGIGLLIKKDDEIVKKNDVQKPNKVCLSSNGTEGCEQEKKNINYPM